jgi:hypothetical protein
VLPVQQALLVLKALLVLLAHKVCKVLLVTTVL